MRIVGRPVRPGHAVGRAALGVRPGAPLLPPDLRPSECILVTPTETPAPTGGIGESFAGVVLTTPGAPPMGAEVLGPPAVGHIDEDLLRVGDEIRLDGDAGALEVPGVKEVPVVTAFLEREDGRILLLRRSEKVGTFQGRWAAVSGHLEDESPWRQALREISEETGLEREDLRGVNDGPTIWAREGDWIYSVRPFRVRVARTDVRLDWEHTESEWVEPSELARRPTVPKLIRAWEAVGPTPAPDAPTRRPKLV